LLENLCRINCTKEEIASVFEISPDTVERRIAEQFGVTFAVFLKRYEGEGKVSLRRLQWASAKKGNVTMQIWLGKQYLAQSDKVATVSSGDVPPIRVIFQEVPDDLMDPKKQENLDIPD